MQYYYILIVTVIACFQSYSVFKTRRKTRLAGNMISQYSHKSSIGGIYLMIIFQIIIIYSDVFKEKYSILLWLLPAIVLLTLAYYRVSRKLVFYESGILALGDFIEWGKIIDLKIEKNEIQIIASMKETQYYTISQIKNAEKCYNQIVALAPSLAAYAPVEEEARLGIDAFLNK